jgi:hypothetical protein
MEWKFSLAKMLTNLRRDCNNNIFSPKKSKGVLNKQCMITNCYEKCENMPIGKLIYNCFW